MSSLHIVQRLIPTHAGKTDLLGSVRKYLPGSSPLTRGKRTCSAPSASICRAHPRSRGENRAASPKSWITPGPSPITRGKPIRGAIPRIPRGLIPAHAGKTVCTRFRSCVRWAHPHAGGENCGRVHAYMLVEGSSPLTRGKPIRGAIPRIPRGLIPAHAGKTVCTRFRSCVRWAHPHAGGENCGRVHAYMLVEGSSPLARGKPHRLVPRVG